MIIIVLVIYNFFISVIFRLK